MARKRPRVVAFSDEKPMFGHGLLGPSHWKAGNALSDQARTEVTSDVFPHSHKIPSIICLYHATIECFLNEQLAWNTAPTEAADEANHKDLIRAVQELQDLLGVQKVQAVLKAFGLLEKFDPQILADFAILNDLRNLAYHHSPEFRPTNEYPEVVVKIVERLGLKHVNTGWLNWLGHVAVMAWCRDHVTAFINEFDRCVGRQERTLQSSGYLTREEFAEWASRFGQNSSKSDGR